jgi:ABC-2 type transport system permease protein
MTTTSTVAGIRATTDSRDHTVRLFGYVGRSLVLQLRDWSFLLFIVAMPTSIYLFFAGIYGDQEADGGVSVAAAMMATMAAYGGLGAAMNAGNTIQVERSSGWFRQLMLTALTPVEFLLAKAAVAVAVIIPAIGVVFAAGALRGVRLDLRTWLASGGLLLVGLLPMIILGLVIGLWFTPQTSQAATTAIMLALSMLGGLWFPLDMMPDAMAAVGRSLPSYWIGRLAVWPLTGGDAPSTAVPVLSAWLIALCLLGVLGYRRAVRTSRR